ncbi:hypothetical protein CK911_01195 [Aeromonas sp. CU5]|uniref:hypothetical protein n=1 Tax=Aeromonas sp. CU5 TaxID=2033033 RepID=UPI000BFBEF75|nr:hypothetical protein [Aeromonas sp. CU5]ATL91564.1 hypothetical protein CK911_01195 [Aeromonas sp. CU5]
MRHVILLSLSIALFIYSTVYVKQQLTNDGEYRASLHVIGDVVTNIHLVTHMKNSEFITHTYLKSTAINGTATFVSKGRFVDDDRNGNYKYSYLMEEVQSPLTVTDTEHAHIYMSMVSRLGLPIEEDIKLLYHHNNISIFDMKRNFNVIMYKKEHQ